MREAGKHLCSIVLKEQMRLSKKQSCWQVNLHYNAAFNRLYYACFYAASALLVANGISASSHSGVKTMLSLNFVSKGLLSTEHGKTFSRLFEIRHSGDYDDFVYCDKEMVDDYTPKSIQFIESIKSLLGK